MKHIWIYESELRAIAQESLSLASETGGDLFGKWETEPVIFLATRLGPDSQRSECQCQFDLAYLEKLSVFLTAEWGLNYFGDWHSHYLSQLTVPSRTDRNRIGLLVQRLGFTRFLEFISNVSEALPDDVRRVSVRGYDFPAATWYSPDALTISVLPGISPIRQILSLRNEELQQDWKAWESMPLELVSGYEDTPLPKAEFVSRHQDWIARRAISEFVRHLEDSFQETVVDQLHPDGREFLLSLPRLNLAIVVASNWPFPLLELVYQTKAGTQIRLPQSNGCTMLEPDRVVKTIRETIEHAHLALASILTEDVSS